MMALSVRRAPETGKTRPLTVQVSKKVAKCKVHVGYRRRMVSYNALPSADKSSYVQRHSPLDHPVEPRVIEQTTSATSPKDVVDTSCRSEKPLQI